MSVKLKTVSTPSDMSPEEFIAYAARVSNPANQNNKDTAEKLIRYLIKNKHWSPLEMVSVTCEIETTRAISRQIIRHKSASFQEFSQRYAEATDFQLVEARLQDDKNRQNSIETDNEELKQAWEEVQKHIIAECDNAYRWALNKGIAKEQARAVLPEGLTCTTLYMSGTLRSWYHWIELRQGNGTQKEHQVLALQAKKELRKVFPTIMGILDEG